MKTLENIMSLFILLFWYISGISSSIRSAIGATIRRDIYSLVVLKYMWLNLSTFKNITEYIMTKEIASIK